MKKYMNIYFAKIFIGMFILAGGICFGLGLIFMYIIDSYPMGMVIGTALGTGAGNGLFYATMLTNKRIKK